MSHLDNAFKTLQIATDLEEEARINAQKSTFIKSANKYLDACELFNKHIHTNTKNHKGISSDNETRAETLLISKKISHYQNHANSLLVIARQGVTQQKKDTLPKTTSFSSSSDVNHLYEEAETQISFALDLDEKGQKKSAIEEYVKAADLLLKSCKQIENQRIPDEKNNSNMEKITILKSRLQGILDRVEQLKKEISKQNYAKRKIPTKSVNHSNAISTFIPSSSKLSSHKSGKQNKQNEKKLSPTEVKILIQSSLIASGLFMPWSDDEILTFPFFGDEKTKQASSTSSSSSWTDPDGCLRLSPLQQTNFFKWARPSQIVQMKKSRFYNKKIKMVHSISPYSIRQKYVTDCSFIASLIVCAAFEHRFHRKIVTGLIYPQDKNGNPIYNIHGRYLVRLWLNGVARKVEVDDLFPIDKHGNILCSHTKCETSFELWVSIIEKAYMKLCGGYDFPGSNSGIDLFALTGWIPEQIYFPEDSSKVRDHETTPDRAWKRLLSAHSFGDSLATVSCSDNLSSDKADEMGLITGHAYAVLNVVNINGIKMLQIKNPWARKSWNGKYSSSDIKTWPANSKLQKELGYNSNLHNKDDDGIFWISWDDILVYFQNMHLSWNPNLFQSRNTVHSSWPVSLGPEDDSRNIGENPQYIITLSNEAIKKKASVWILLSRHVTKKEQEGSIPSQFLSLHINRSDEHKERQYYPMENRLLTGVYVNDTHVLLRHDVLSSKDKYLTLILSQHKKSEDMNYTLNCFCTSPIEISAPAKQLPYKQQIVSQWTKETSGGPPTLISSFYTNPMWKIVIPEGGTKIQFLFQTMKALAINILLFKDSVNNIAINSGSYRREFVATNVQTLKDGGEYVMVPNTFKQGETGSFVINILSSKPLSVESA